MIEVDDEGLVLVFPQNFVQKRSAGREFLLEDAPLTQGSVYEQTEGEGQIGLLGEISDGLRLAVLIQGKILFGEIVDQCAVFVVDRGQEIDGGDIDRELRGLLGDKRGDLKTQERQKATPSHDAKGREDPAESAAACERFGCLQWCALSLKHSAWGQAGLSLER